MGRHAIEKDISTIIQNGNPKDMHELSEMLIDMMSDIEKIDKDLFCDYKMGLYILANGKVLNISSLKSSYEFQ